eukprot:360627-Chlamydomonas_euryale.AAC.7
MADEWQMSDLLVQRGHRGSAFPRPLTWVLRRARKPLHPTALSSPRVQRCTDTVPVNVHGVTTMGAAALEGNSCALLLDQRAHGRKSPEKTTLYSKIQNDRSRSGPWHLRSVIACTLQGWCAVGGRKTALGRQLHVMSRLVAVGRHVQEWVCGILDIGIIYPVA